MAEKFVTGLTRLINNEDLTRPEAKHMFCRVLNNEESDMHQGAFLAALAAKKETETEIAAAWEAIYELDTVKVHPKTDAPLVDNSGTGMDSLKTFNISTAASIVAATAGVKMAKHGSRAITSKCGTIDVLEELGIDVECEPEIVKQSIEKTGIGIFNGMDSRVHPRALSRILSQISFGSILNISASLANPALPKYAVRGVYSRELLESAPRVMREIGYKRALIVYGLDEDGIRGIDEASTLNKTLIAELQPDGSIDQYSFYPEDFEIKRASKEDLLAFPTKQEGALGLIKILKGEDPGPKEDIVCLNAALVLYIANHAESIKKGYQISKDIVATGQSIDKLRDWICHQNVRPEIGLEKLETLLAWN